MSETSEAVTTTNDTTQPLVEGLLARALAFRQNKEFKRFSKFFAVGLIGAIIDNGTLNGLKASGWLASIKIALPFGLTITDLGIAGTIAFILAVASNFVWNRYWVYPDSRSKSIASQIATFFVVNAFGIVIRIPILELLSEPFASVEHLALPQINPTLIARLGENTAWALAVIVVMFWNFFVNRYWTYSDVK